MSKSYLNIYKRELGHLCPSGILRSISLSPTTCLSTWMYHSLFITISLLVQVGLISLGRLFNMIGTMINPHLELTQSSPYQDTVVSSIGIRCMCTLGARYLYDDQDTTSASYHPVHLSYSHSSTTLLIGRSHSSNILCASMLDHAHVPSIYLVMKPLEEVYQPYLVTYLMISLTYHS